MLNLLAAAPAAVLATASAIRIERAKSVEFFWLLILFPIILCICYLFFCCWNELNLKDIENNKESLSLK